MHSHQTVETQEETGHTQFATRMQLRHVVFHRPGGDTMWRILNKRQQSQPDVNTKKQLPKTTYRLQHVQFFAESSYLRLHG
jgi:hypothetical protein